jgi:hypothetical protein
MINMHQQSLHDQYTAVYTTTSPLRVCLHDYPHFLRISTYGSPLQESLGGNAKTTLVVCVADAVQHADETLQSLQFGSRAMCVKNKPVVGSHAQTSLCY